MVGRKRKQLFSASASSSASSKNKQPSTNLTAGELNSLLSRVASATSLSLQFLSENDLLLRPSQNLTLESSIHSAALSLSRLLSLLNQSPQTLTLDPPPSPSPYWFHRFLSFPSSDHRWLEAFRMSKPSFYLLLQTLAPSLQSSPLPLPSDHKLGAALFRLAHAAPFRSVARRFGMPFSAFACRAFYEVCKAIADQLGHLFELSSDLKRVLQGFNWMSLPNCCGVLSFSRFTLDGVSKGGSLIAQALVDSEGRFLDVSVGWHGSMNPAQILTRTKLYAAQSVVLASAPAVEFNGGSVMVPRYFLGGSCCPLLPWLLTPFKKVDSDSGNSNSSKDVIFNTVHARGMELADRAFARWGM